MYRQDIIYSFKNRSMPFTIWLIGCAVFFAPLKAYGLPIGFYGLSFFKFFSLASFLFMIIDFVRRDRFKVSIIEAFLIVIPFITFFQSLLFDGSLLKGHGIYVLYNFSWVACVLVYMRNYYNYSNYLFNLLVLSFVIPLLIAVYQIIILYTVGFVPPLPISFLADELEMQSFNIYQRITSCYGDPSYFAAVINSGFLIALSVLLSNSLFTKKLRSISMFIVFSSLVALIATMSGTGIISLIIVLLILFFLIGIQKSTIIKIFMGTILIFIFLLCANFYTDGLLLESFLFKIGFQLNNDHGILYSRGVFFESALNAFFNSPILGVGPGNLPIVGNSNTSSAHCSLLTVLSEQGICIFLLCIYIFIYKPLLIIYKMKETKQKNFLYILYLSWIVLVIQSFGYDLLFKIDSNFTVFMILLLYLNKNIYLKNMIAKQCSAI